jgi:hypothetical protein
MMARVHPHLRPVRPLAITTAAAGRVREVAEIVYTARLRPPAGAGRVARFAYGLGLPLALVRALLGDPAARRRYVRTCSLQAAIILVLGVVFLAGDMKNPDRSSSSEPHVAVDVDSNERDDGSGTIALDEEDSSVKRAAKLAAAKVERTAKLVESMATLAVAKQIAAEQEKEEERKRGAGRLASLAERGFAFWSALYGTLCLVEWIVVAVSREHHDAIGVDAARLTGALPEDAPARPRVHVNFQWLLKTLRRKLHGFLIFVTGTTVLGALTLIPVLGHGLYAAAAALWGAYWLAIFVGAKSAQSWKYEFTAPPPWFVTRWERLTESTPGFRWWLPRAIGRLLRRLTARFCSPAYRFERCPYELAGLALARVIGGLPGMYMFFRPLVPVAAAHIFGADDEQKPAPLPAHPGSDDANNPTQKPRSLRSGEERNQ